jgi:hypothetical protein
VAFHTVVYTSSITGSGATTFVQLNFKADVIVPTQNLGLQVPKQLNRFGFTAGVGVSLCNYRAQTPAFLPFPWPTFAPVNRGAAFESPPRQTDLFKNPLPMNPTDELDIFVCQNLGAAEVEYVFVTLTDGMVVPAPMGRFFTVHAVGSTTLTAGAFTSCALTFDQAIPAGLYACIGARCFSATALGFRLAPAMEPLWRPGGTAVRAYDQMDPPGQRGYIYDGQVIAPWGVWMTFFQNVPPQVDVFATGADTAEEVWLDLIQLNTTTVYTGT